MALEKKECKRCGYIWMSFLPKPKACPKCKSYEWENDPIWKRVKV